MSRSPKGFLFPFDQDQQADSPAPRPFDAARDVRNYKTKKAKMLRRIKEGRLSTFDAENLFHRGQAAVRSLIEEGYRIVKKEIDGVMYYVYLGTLPLVAVPKAMQDAYYNSTHWRRISAERREIDEHACRQCGSGDDLEVHHWKYDLFAEDVQEDLATFCADHHQMIHQRIAGSGVHFPRFVTEEIAKWIEAGT
jgi:hypothetical protein